MNFIVDRRLGFLPAFAAALLGLGFVAVPTSLFAQGGVQGNASSAVTSGRLSNAGALADTVDLSGVRDPAEIGTAGRVMTGDDPAWAGTDFDDSKWLPVNGKTRLNEYFPGSRAGVVWRRIRVKIDPANSKLALQAYSISRAFEVYVNGEKALVSGSVEPYVPYTRGARMIFSIPEAQLHTGELVIAVRMRAPTTWWTSLSPAFNGPMLTLGEESSLADRKLLSIIGEDAATFIEDLLAGGVGLVAIALFLGQRKRIEYLWIFVLGALNVAFLPMQVMSGLRNIPVSWWVSDEFVQFGTWLVILLMIQSFLRRLFGKLMWFCAVPALLIASGCNVAYEVGIMPVYYDPFLTIPIGIIFAVVVPALLFRQMRRGDREAGLLLIPFIFNSLFLYISIAIGFLGIFPPLRNIAIFLTPLVGAFPLGIFSVNMADLGSLSFFFSLVIIIVLRSARMSREQGLLEGEVAAAREVQQVILPEQVECFPGFTVESIYEPAQQVGGDFFQIIADETDGSMLVVAGDVSGKGLQAGMLVALLVGAIRTVADASAEPEFVLRALNQRLLGRNQSQATCLALRVDADGEATLANAGHLPPYLNGEPMAMEGALPLGMMEGAEFSVMRFRLEEGDKLMLVSDGIVEATDADGRLFGFDRVLELVRGAATAAEVASAAQRFGQEDDISVISVTRTAGTRVEMFEAVAV